MVLLCQFIGKNNEVDRAEAVKVCCKIEKILQIYVILTKKQFYYNLSNDKLQTVPYTISMAFRGHTISMPTIKQLYHFEILLQIIKQFY